MATRTAPTIDGTPVAINLSIQLIDSDGSKRAVDYVLPNDTTDAEMELIVSTLQLATNASIYTATVGYAYSSNPVAGNATNATVQGVEDNVVILFKNDTELKSQQAYIPAPLETIFVAGTKNIDIADTVYANYRNAVHDALDNTLWAPISVRFTARRQMNQKQNRA